MIFILLPSYKSCIRSRSCFLVCSKSSISLASQYSSACTAWISGNLFFIWGITDLANSISAVLISCFLADLKELCFPISASIMPYMKLSKRLANSSCSSLYTNGANSIHSSPLASSLRQAKASAWLYLSTYLRFRRTTTDCLFNAWIWLTIIPISSSRNCWYFTSAKTGSCNSLISRTCLIKILSVRDCTAPFSKPFLWVLKKSKFCP